MPRITHSWLPELRPTMQAKCALVVGSSVAVFRVESEALREEEILKHMKILVSIEDVRVAGNAG